jgi:hypothetical protein
MKGETSKTSQLISLALEALEEGLDEEVRLERIERYSTSFGAWMESGGSASDSERATLLTLHSRVLTQAEELLEQIGKARKSLHSRARGVMKYVDTLPKRISWTRGRKG